MVSAEKHNRQFELQSKPCAKVRRIKKRRAYSVVKLWKHADISELMLVGMPWRDEYGRQLVTRFGFAGILKRVLLKHSGF